MDTDSKKFLPFLGNPAFSLLMLVGFLIGVSLIWLAYVTFSIQTGEVRTVYVADTKIHVTVADSSLERERGLSGRVSMPEDEGLLFVFAYAGDHGFWMKDMLFPIDILWFGEMGELVHVEERVTPDSYPNVFSPGADSLYALELPAGFVERHGVKIGDQLTF